LVPVVHVLAFVVGCLYSVVLTRFACSAAHWRACPLFVCRVLWSTSPRGLSMSLWSPAVYYLWTVTIRIYDVCTLHSRA
jgi:hypothetical protein